MQISLLLPILLCAGLLVFWISDRNRFTAQIRTLSYGQRELQTSLNGFMEESEKIALELSRLISANRMPISDLGEAGATGAGRRDTKLSRPKKNATEKKHMVLNLAQKGRKVSEIAERLRIPPGEIELILNLNKSKRAVRTPA